jgi:hypothetical protein
MHILRKALILILGTLLVGAFYTFGNLFAANLLSANLDVSLADEASGTATADEPTSEEDYACARNMLADGGVFLDDYMAFLNEYFKQDVPSSEQIPVAMEFYRYTEDMLENIWAVHADLSASETGKTLDLGISEYLYCANIRDQLITQAELMLQAYARYSADSKRTFEIIDGLKSINEDLRAFSGDFYEVFPGKFAKMDDSLKCYAKECITK